MDKAKRSGTKYILKIVRSACVVLSIIALAWFMIPLSLSVSLNIGNITGIAVSVILFLYAINMPRIHRLFAALRTDKGKRWIYQTVIGIVCLVAGVVIIETICMIGAANKEPKADATVVVLGCRVYGTRASLSMVERLEAAYDYLVEHETASCVLSGGRGEGEDITEAECMYRYLINKGIEPSRLYKEERSSSTRENLKFSKVLIEKEGLNPAIAITTSEYHQYRAGKIAETLDIEYGSNPGQTAIWLFPTYYVRELYGILYEWFSK